MQQLAPNVFVESDYYPTASFVVTSAGVVAIDGLEKPSDAIEYNDFIVNEHPFGKFGRKRK